MNIRNWPMDQIMQLPDCCFGRRFSVCVSVSSTNKAANWDISELALPEKCVLWEVVVVGPIVGTTIIFDYIRLALGDQLPTSPAMMNALEPLIPGLGVQGAEPRQFPTSGWYLAFHLRNPIAAMGRRLVVEGVGATTGASIIHVICEFSSMPTEVPDWLISGNLRSP